MVVGSIERNVLVNGLKFDVGQFVIVIDQGRKVCPRSNAPLLYLFRCSQL